MPKFATKLSIIVKMGQFCVLSTKSTPARKKYTTADCGGCDEYVKQFTFTRISQHSSHCVDVLNLSCSFVIKDFCRLNHCWQSSNYFVFFQKSCKISDLLSELLLLASSINFTSVTELILLQNNVRTTLHWERERKSGTEISFTSMIAFWFWTVSEFFSWWSFLCHHKLFLSLL